MDLLNSCMVMGFYKKIHRPIVLEKNRAYKVFKILMGMEYLGFLEKTTSALHVVKGI